MKHFVWAFIALLAVVGSSGCDKMHGNLLHKNKVCSQCGGKGCPACGYGAHAQGMHGGHGMHAANNGNIDPHYYGGPGACPNCGPGGPGGAGAYGAGPGQVVYPYYTTRGPRDFLANNPPELGP